MKLKIIIVLLIVLILVLLWFLWWRPHHARFTVPTVQNCADRAEQMVAQWKGEGRDAASIDKLFQAEMAKCSGVVGACAAMVGAANADLAWLGRAVLSGSMSPADYLARVHDRTRKLRELRKNPSLCDAYARGDADGDLVPDDRDRCPGTPSLTPTDSNGCPDTSPPPPAPSREAVQQAAAALKIPLSKACVDAPLPERGAVLKAGSAPDQQSFLLVVSRAANQPAGCPLFYEVDIRIHVASFFQQRNTTTLYHRVFRATDSLSGPLARPTGMTFQLPKSDPTVPWDSLTFRPVEPNEISERYFRVRTVNGNGFTQGWGAFTLVPSTAFP
jgi:hypothetical protein